MVRFDHIVDLLCDSPKLFNWVEIVETPHPYKKASNARWNLTAPIGNG